ncbi:MAG: cysteine dioxygenase family protein [Flavobacteriales bacterium]|nr:cysteine dioxygenase family protein [Flavobacteriales bacterium]MCB9166841.1 cysteine dioxygenase family protein [Flavobacteriales bacterium]
MHTTPPLDLLHFRLARIAALFDLPRIGSAATRHIGLEDIAYRLTLKAMTLPKHATAEAFRPLMEQAMSIPARAWDFLVDAPEGRHVLVDNTFLKVLLIRWAPGALGARHYHPNGGGLIAVLDGAIQEARYLNGTIAAPYETQVRTRRSITYMDDSLGMHTVGAPFSGPAVTLHAYLKYR